MRYRVWLLAAPLLLAAVIGGSCGDDAGSQGSDSGPGGVVNGEPTATVASPVETVPSETTPTSLEALRDPLRERLDGIGINIGDVPEDVGEQLLNSCRQLNAFADGEAVTEICDTLELAIEQGDPGLIDTVLDQLAELEAA